MRAKNTKAGGVPCEPFAAVAGVVGIAVDELIVDNFAGGGGASTGIEAALGRPIDIAVNHDPEAVAMHAINHPRTQHLIENVWAVDIVKVIAGRKIGLAWFSPDCKHFSKAKGGKPVSKKIRGLAWVALKWAGLVRPRVIMIENVEEFQTWGPVVNGKPCPKRKGSTFKRWVKQLRDLGYAVEWREMRACEFGAPTIRKRLFIVARRDGQAISWPEPTHAPAGDLFRKPYRTATDCIDWLIPCASIFLTKAEGRAVGVNRPLAEATMDRIARGVKRYVIDAAEPFIINITHQGGDRNESINEPFRTVTAAKRGEKALVIPFIERQFGESSGNAADVPLGTTTAGGGGKSALIAAHITRFNQNGDGHAMEEQFDTVMAGAPRFALCSTFLAHTAHGETGKDGKKRWGKGEHGATETLPTVTGSPDLAVVSAFLAGVGGRAGQSPERSMGDPHQTITAKADGALVTSHLVKLRGTCLDGQPVSEPMATISAQGTHIGEVRAFLIKYYGTDQNPELREPMHTLTTKDRIGLVMVQGQEYLIVDIGMRMLTPRELFRAQGFPESYIIDHGADPQSGASVKLTKTAQVRMCGNSVSPPPAEALVRAQFGLSAMAVPEAA